MMNTNSSSSLVGARAAIPLILWPGLIALIATLVVWFGIYYFWPPISGMEQPIDRLIYAIKCSCVAITLCFLTGIEAVAHERLQTNAFDPLAGNETRRLKVNLRYLQNTLEQTILFVPGLIALAVYCADGNSMRAVVATTAVWILSRFAFWIGYHQGSAYRVVGLTGLVQSLLVLLYVCARFGYEVAGGFGAAVPLVVFGLIEIFLVKATRPSLDDQAK